jgi:ribose transport system permease protein
MGGMMNRKTLTSSLKNIVSNRITLTFVAFFVIALFSGIFVPAALKGANITNVLRQASILGIVAIGQGIVMLSGGMDISVGNIMFAVMIYGGRFMESSDHRLIPIAIACLIAGACIGCINGLGVAKFKISPIIMTLGTSSILYGAVYIFGGNMMTSPAPFVLQAIGKKLLFNWVPLLGVFWLVVSVAAIFLLTKTTFGRRVYATGNNSRAAWFGGVQPIQVQVASYMICDTLAALAGLLLLGYLKAPTLRFTDIYTIGSISAAVIGGIEFFTGVGHIAGSIAGTLVVRYLFTVLVMLHVPEAGRMIVEGMMIITIVSLNKSRIRL